MVSCSIYQRNDRALRVKTSSRSGCYSFSQREGEGVRSFSDLSNSDEEGDYTPFRRLPRLKKLPKKSKASKGQVSQDNVVVSEAQIRYGILYSFDVDLSEVTEIDITREEESKGSKEVSSHSSRGIVGGLGAAAAAARRTLD